MALIFDQDSMFSFNCLQNWHKNMFNIRAFSVQVFHILTATLLSLLLPLSFLLLARLSCYNYLLTITSNSAQPPFSFFFSPLLLNIIPASLYSLASVIGIATLLNGLTGQNTLSSHQTPGTNVYRPHLFTSWILLCTLQTCMGLGIEGSLAAGIDGSISFSFVQTSLLSRVIFFLGLHETMLHWFRGVVKPVVDDTIFGMAREERWVHRVIMAVSSGTLWWWKLRGEVESLVIVAEVKRELKVHVGVADLVGWWLYYLTVSIGMVRVVKNLMWVGVVLLCRRVRVNSSTSCSSESSDDDKV